MKNEKGIGLIKLIVIVVVIIVIALFIISKISQRMEKAEKEQQEAQLVAKYETSYNIGDTITTDKLEITVTNVEERTKVGVPKYYEQVDDDYYVLICATIEIKNISSESVSIINDRPDYSILFKLEDERGNKYYNDTDYTVHYQFEFDEIVNENTVNPDETTTVVIAFKLDKSKYNTRAFYLTIWGDNALVKIN